MSAIEVKNLIKRYETTKKKPGLLGTIGNLFNRKKFYVDSVRDISFTVEEGEIVGFVGPNGAGKTTTLKILSGILYATSGSVKVLGFRPHDRENAFKKQFGIVMGQKNQLYRLLPASDNFELFKEFYGISDQVYEKHVNELVDILGIRDILDIPVRKLSLGQRMKCELVASLLHNPKVLFLDEPTIGLDVVAQKNIRDFIKKYNKERKTTILLTSHYMDDIQELCDRVIIINLGKIIYDGKLDSLKAKYAKDKVIIVTTLERVPKEVFEKYGLVEEYEGVRAVIRVPREKTKNVAAEIISSQLPIDDLLIDELPIDDVIREIFLGK